MKCPKCQFENPGKKKFCGKCGARLEIICPHCQSANPPDFQFCGDCGQRLEEPTLIQKPAPPFLSERKYVTVLFSDITGYTTMTEKLDPEEVKEIMSRIFGEVAQVVVKYEGFIEKFVGDAVMALFGVPKSHEDDPVRAIRVAREIHKIVSSISPQYEKRIGKPLNMHTGICTGIVVTGDINIARGTHGILGDTVNLAFRLLELAKPGMIVVSSDTYRQAEGYFSFEPLEPVTLKGKAEPIKTYRVVSPKIEPVKTHRLSGMRAELIGRKVEMAQLNEAVENLKQGVGSLFTIVGDAGTGKSRLIEEFKAGLDLDTIRWHEGHAYAYTQNIPYFPLINLLNRAYQIQEADPPEQVRMKIESGTRYLVENWADLIPYIGNLYSLRYPDIEEIGPELWKVRFYEAIHTIFAALAQRGPTVICLEDLHWADLSSLELLRNIFYEFQHPALFLCIHRSPLTIFTSQQTSGLGKNFQEIRLHDLSSTESQNMVESLLNSKVIPSELREFIRTRVEGNPFYLEEVINALIESETLVKEAGFWKLKKSLSEVNIPSTVQGILSGRIDRLESETKRILQEASVIGRAFLYEILDRITEWNEHIERSLTGLERLDLIRVKSLQPDLEYIFKHALTQEVVYNGILKKERQNIHERIGLVIEDLFSDRIPEFYETLAFHFMRGHSNLKAVDYLMKAGEKNLSKFALNEAHQCYQDAFNLIEAKIDKTKEEIILLVEILLQWSVILYRQCHFTELVDLLKANESLVLSLNDKERIGMFYARLGGALNWSNNLVEAHAYLNDALEISEQTGNEKVLGYAYIFLPWSCADLGMLDKAIEFGRKAQELDLYKTDPDFFRHVSFYIGYTHYFRGDVKGSREIGNKIIEFAEKYSRLECLSDGYLCLTFADLVAGDFISAIEKVKKAYQFALDPLIKITSTTFLGMAYVSAGKYQEAQNTLEELTKVTDICHSATHGTVAKLYTGITKVINGSFKEGMRLIEDVTAEYQKSRLKYRYAICNHLLGQIYAQLAGGEGRTAFSIILKNIGFLIKTAPFAYRNAESYFFKAIETAEEIGANGVLGQAYFDLGRLYKSKNKNVESSNCFSRAISIFEKCESDIFLKQAKEALASLG